MRARNLTGYHRDHHDRRDIHLMASAKTLKATPPEIDWREICPPVYDQKNLGSCTAFASLGALHFTLLEQMPGVPELSELFQYYVTRKDQGTVNQDSGASIRGAMKAMGRYGYLELAQYPYQTSKFKQNPGQALLGDAATRKIPDACYARITDSERTSLVKAVLAQRNPVVIGFTVYSSFMSPTVAKSGVMPMPKKSDRVEGGHAVTLVGYSDKRGAALVRNSWGSSFGQGGYFWMPYEFLYSQNVSDVWAMLSAPSFKPRTATLVELMRS